MILPKVSQNILGHDIAKNIPKYPRPWHFCSHKCHILALWLLMLKCKQDCIHYKGLLHGISKLNDKKPLLSWFKCMMKKKCWKNLNACKLTNHESFFIHSTLTHGLHFLFLIGLVRFRISIADIPCEFKMFCITNLIHPNCYGKIIILSIYENVVHGINPTPTWVCQWCVTICWKLILPIKVV